MLHEYISGVSRKSLMSVAEAALQGCSKEKVFLKYAANLQENTYVEVRFR